MTFILTIVLAAAQSGASSTADAADRQRLKQASNQGEVKTVEEILTAHPELSDAADERGVSFLLGALYRGRKEVAEAYVKRRDTFSVFEASALGRVKDLDLILRKDPGAATRLSPDGFIPLGLAAFFAHEDAVKFLLAHGADVNQYGKVPHVQALHSAAAGKCLECVRALLEKGADPNAPQDEGFRALHEAASNNDRAMAELLIAKGAAAGIKNDKGKTPADFARERGHSEMAAWLDSLKK